MHVPEGKSFKINIILTILRLLVSNLYFLLKEKFDLIIIEKKEKKFRKMQEIAKPVVATQIFRVIQLFSQFLHQENFYY